MFVVLLVLMKRFMKVGIVVEWVQLCCSLQNSCGMLISWLLVCLMWCSVVLCVVSEVLLMVLIIIYILKFFFNVFRVGKVRYVLVYSVVMISLWWLVVFIVLWNLMFFQELMVVWLQVGQLFSILCSCGIGGLFRLVLMLIVECMIGRL